MLMPSNGGVTRIRVWLHLGQMPHSDNIPIFRPYLPHTSQGVVVGTALTPTPQECKVSYNYKVGVIPLPLLRSWQKWDIRYPPNTLSSLQE